MLEPPQVLSEPHGTVAGQAHEGDLGVGQPGHAFRVPFLVQLGERLQWVDEMVGDARDVHFFHATPRP